MLGLKEKRETNYFQDNDLVLLPFAAILFLASLLTIASYLLVGPLGIPVTIITATSVLLLAAWFLKKEDREQIEKGSDYLLIVANEEIDSEEFQQELLLRQSDNIKIKITIPIQAKNNLASLANDIDSELKQGHNRLKRLDSFAKINNLDLDAQISIESGPVQSAIDEIESISVAEVLMITNEKERWPSEEKTKEALSRIPVSVIKKRGRG